MTRKMIAFFGCALACVAASVVAQTEPDSEECAPGTLLWQRDAETFYCAPLCSTDDDCGDLGRCRILEVFDAAPAQEIVLIDDVTEEEAVELLEPESRPPAVAICDVFFDVPGALDAL